MSGGRPQNKQQQKPPPITKLRDLKSSSKSLRSLAGVSRCQPDTFSTAKCQTPLDTASNPRNPQTTTATASADNVQGARPAGLVEDVDEDVPHEGDAVADGGLVDLVGGRLKGPVDEQIGRAHV